MESFVAAKELFSPQAAGVRMSDKSSSSRALDRQALGAFTLYFAMSFSFLDVD
jgi:hypothetical protein